MQAELSCPGDIEVKTDIVFFQQLPMPYLGIIALDARLKEAGVATDVVIDTLEKDPIAVISKLNPGMIGFSVFSSEHTWLVKKSGEVRRHFPGTPIIVGGIHARIYPESILRDTPASLVCISDGEKVILDTLHESQADKPDWSRIRGIAYKEPEGVIKINPPAPFEEYREDLVEERTLYFDRYPVLARDGMAYFMASRGCPYSCSFCYNHYMRSMSPNPGKYIRRKSVANMISEIELVISRSRVKNITFVDDLFTLDVNWLREFAPEYKKRIALPFNCSTRANYINEEVARLLKEAGCRNASYSVETGNEYIRNAVLKKRISDEDIIRAGGLLKKHGIGARTSTMFCLPGERVEDALKSVKLNIEGQVTSPASTLLLPYPNTEITEFCKEQKMIPENFSLYDLPHISEKESILELPDKKKIINVHYLLYWFTRYPLLFRLFRWVVYLEWINPVLYIIYRLGYLVRGKNEHGMSWFEAFIFGWRKRNLIRPNN